MGHTHTKLLAGAFSVLSVLQFFMVYDLSKQVDQFTETAMVSSMATVRRVPAQFGSADPRITNRGLRQTQGLMNRGLTSREILLNRSNVNAVGNSVQMRTSAPSTEGMKMVITPRGNKLIYDSHGVTQDGLAPVTTEVQ